MTEYKNKYDLYGKTLQKSDIIKFTKGKLIVTMEVSSSYLRCINVSDNGNRNNFRPLKMVGLKTIEQRNVFCSKYYGYPIIQGDWPEYRENDMEAITKTVMAIYDILNGEFSWRKKYE